MGRMVLGLDLAKVDQATAVIAMLDAWEEAQSVSLTANSAAPSELADFLNLSVGDIRQSIMHHFRMSGEFLDLQGLCEIMALECTGSNIYRSQVRMHNHLRYLQRAGLLQFNYMNNRNYYKANKTYKSCSSKEEEQKLFLEYGGDQ